MVDYKLWNVAVFIQCVLPDVEDAMYVHCQMFLWWMRKSSYLIKISRILVPHWYRYVQCPKFHRKSLVSDCYHYSHGSCSFGYAIYSCNSLHCRLLQEVIAYSCKLTLAKTKGLSWNWASMMELSTHNTMLQILRQCATVQLGHNGFWKFTKIYWNWN